MKKTATRVLAICAGIELIIILILGMNLFSERQDSIEYTVTSLDSALCKYQDTTDLDGSNYYVTTRRTGGAAVNLEVSRQDYELIVCDPKLHIHLHSISTKAGGRNCCTLM